MYIGAYSIIRYISTRPFAKTVSSSVDVKNEDNIIRTILERIRDFFYS